MLPARTDTRAFHAYVMQSESICIVRGRRRFARAKAPAPFPVLFAYRGPRVTEFDRVFGGEGVIWHPTVMGRLHARGYALRLRPGPYQ